VNPRGEGGGPRRARCGRTALRALVALALLALAAAASVVACGGSSSADIGPYLGVWQRVDGGVPNPDFTLTVARQGDQGAVTFANLANGQAQTVAATVEDGYLACTLPTGDDPAPSPAAGVPTESDLQLSLDENGQLVVDLVLADGTLEPVWIYDRPPASAPAEP
jgi:hypothetical protein